MDHVDLWTSHSLSLTLKDQFSEREFKIAQLFFYFLTKTYVVGTQKSTLSFICTNTHKVWYKHLLNEKVFWAPKTYSKKIVTIFCSKFV